MVNQTPIRALVIASNYGAETAETIESIDGLRAAGIEVSVAAISREPIRTLELDVTPGLEVPVDSTLEEVDPNRYDVLVIPGGTLNADALRTNAVAQDIAGKIAAQGKLIASVCHGPWLLVDANLVTGRSLTSYPTIRTDIENAGGSWVDEEVQIDTAGAFPLITSRSPDDMDAFVGAIVEHALER